MKLSAVLVVLVLAIVLTHGCLGQNNPPVDNTAGNNTSTSIAITKQMCEQYRGHWNECGSACRGAPEGTPCILMCVTYCECGGEGGFDCPPSYFCTDYIPKGAADATGICKKVSE